MRKLLKVEKRKPFRIQHVFQYMFSIFSSLDSGNLFTGRENAYLKLSLRITERLEDKPVKSKMRIYSPFHSIKQHFIMESIPPTTRFCVQALMTAKLTSQTEIYHAECLWTSLNFASQTGWVLFKNDTCCLTHNNFWELLCNVMLQTWNLINYYSI